MTKNSSNKPGGHFTAFLILAAISAAILLAGLVLGTEPRLVMERTSDRAFRVTASNHIAGQRFYIKTIEGVTEVTQDDAVRDGRHDSAKDNRRRRRQKHLDFFGSDGARIGWDRETDQRAIEEFMRGQDTTMSLSDPPPTWRLAASWFCLILGSLSFVGAIQSSFFPKKSITDTPK